MLTVAGAVLLVGAVQGFPVRAEVEAAHFGSWPVGFLGVRVAEVDPVTATRLELPEERGVVILAVERKSPAEQSRLQVDDVLWTFRGEALHSIAQLRRLLRETPPGRKLSVAFYRNGLLQSGSIALARDDQRAEFHLDLPDFHLTFPRDFLQFGPFGTMPRPRLGVSVISLTEQLADHLGAKGGLLVTSVEPASSADKAGIRAGDVIQRVDRRSLEGVADLRNALKDKDEVSFELVRDRKTRTVKVRLDTPRLREPIL